MQVVTLGWCYKVTKCAQKGSTVYSCNTLTWGVQPNNQVNWYWGRGGPRDHTTAFASPFVILDMQVSILSTYLGRQNSSVRHVRVPLGLGQQCSKLDRVKFRQSKATEVSTIQLQMCGLNTNNLYRIVKT